MLSILAATELTLGIYATSPPFQNSLRIKNKNEIYISLSYAFYHPVRLNPDLLLNIGPAEPTYALLEVKRPGLGSFLGTINHG